MPVPVLLGSKRLKYWQKVRQTAPANLIGYWPMWEPSGSTSFDISNEGNDGAYTGVALGSQGIGDGRSSPTFDGTNDFNNVYSAGLAADDLLSNSGFETAGGGGADIWGSWSETAGDGALANETTAKHAGSDAAKITAGAGLDTLVSQNITVTAGKSYRLRFFTRGDASNAGRYKIRDVSNSADIVALTSTGVAGTTFTAVTVAFTAPAGCSSVGITFQCPATDTGDAYFDSSEVRSADGFDGDEGTIAAWAKAADADVWTDATVRYIMDLRVDGNNVARMYKHSNDGLLLYEYVADSVVEQGAQASFTSTDFFHMAMTWSAAGDVVRYYIDGASASTDDTVLGTWIGDLSSSLVCVGAISTVPSDVWDGEIAHAALWNTPLTAAQIASLAIR